MRLWNEPTIWCKPSTDYPFSDPSHRNDDRVVGDPFTPVDQGPQIDDRQFAKILDCIDSGINQGSSTPADRFPYECCCL